MSNKRQVLRKLADAGVGGFTDTELCITLPSTPPSTVRGCRKQLERSSLCYRRGSIKTPATGRQAAVFVITELGRKYLRLDQTLPIDRGPDTERALLARVASKLGDSNEMTCGSARGAGWLCSIKRSDGSRCFNYFSAPTLAGAISASLTETGGSECT